ncbi:MAG: V-type ATP synthase subunit D [Euryarchaeota archaeon]
MTQQDILEDVNPTRMELLKLKDRIELAKKGHKLLKEKRDALIMEFFDLVKKASEVRERAVEKLMKAYEKLAAAKTTVGAAGVRCASMAAAEEVRVDVGSRNVMGVVVPILERVSGDGGVRLAYGFADTSGALDEAVHAFREALDAVLELAEIEETLRLMAEEIERTKRRVNALEHIVIPRLESTEKYIEMKLDEQERENFVRLKRVKSMIERRRVEELEERLRESGAELPELE